MFLNRIRRSLSWRWRLERQKQYLRKTFSNGDELIKSFLAKTACDHAFCRDGTVICHPAGRIGLAPMILEVWFDDVYTGAFYRPKTKDLIIDAGANIGLFSLLMARRYPSCRVIAFEPFQENFQLLQKNLAAANATSVEAHQIALAGESGVGAMTECGTRSQDHRLSMAAVANDTATIRTWTFADVFELAGADPVAMFKCDIEGSERDLFRQVDASHLRRVQKFAIEYHDNIHPGTLKLLQDRLKPTHELMVKPSPSEGRYGMLYATVKND